MGGMGELELALESQEHGRLPVPGRTKLKGRTSLAAAILCRNVLQVGQFLVDTGFCSFPQRGKCRCDEPKWKLEACRESCTWRCLRCRIALSSQESGLGGQKLPLKSIAGALWIYTSKLHLSPNWHRLFETFNKCFVSSIEQLNDCLVVGGVGADVALDEVAFRSVGRSSIVWLRYMVASRRGSSLVWLERLPYKITEAGQGGGGPICRRLCYWTLMSRSVQWEVCTIRMVPRRTRL